MTLTDKCTAKPAVPGVVNYDKSVQITDHQSL